MINRLITLFLVLILILGTVPVDVYAQETTPETTVPETTVPETTIPETTVPETTIPETTIPETTIPATTAPETTVPETTAPLTTDPEPTVPEATGIELRKLAEGEEYTQMTVSQQMLDMIKVFEGFSAKAYWDVSQYSYGYGTRCNRGDTITEPEAAALLERQLAEHYGKTVNEFCAKIGRQPSQQQFDALVDFTYNLGSAWTRDSWLSNWLKNPTTEMDFVNAIGRWGRVNSKVSYGTCMRRIREAIIFIKGEYYLPKAAPDYIETDLPVITNGNLPYYKLAVLKGNEGMYDHLPDEITYYAEGSNYGFFRLPVREGYTLTEWMVTKVNGSSVDAYSITAGDVVEDHLELTAVWVETPNAPGETVPEITVPETTVPETTVPETTVPETTVPETTESTVPPTSEPEPTDPPVTNPGNNVPDVDTNTDIALPFRDVSKSAWYRDSVAFVYSNGYMTGMTDTTFGPNVSLTRGMMIAVLYRIAGSPEVSPEDREFFVDSQNDYYTDAIGWAKANGIAYGVSETRFAPKQKLLRQDAMAIFYRYCTNYLGMDGSCSGDLSGFSDRGRVADYAKTSVSWGVDQGLLNGSLDHGVLRLNPRGNMTRAEAATVLRSLVMLILGNI